MISEDVLSWSQRLRQGKASLELFWRVPEPDPSSPYSNMRDVRGRYSKFYVGEDEVALVSKMGVRSEIARPGVYPLESEITELIFVPRVSILKGWGFPEVEAPPFADGAKFPIKGEVIMRIADPGLFVKEVIAGKGFATDRVAFDHLKHYMRTALNDYVTQGRISGEAFQRASASEIREAFTDRLLRDFERMGIKVESISAYMGEYKEERVVAPLPPARESRLAGLIPGYTYSRYEARARTDLAVREKAADEIRKAERTLAEAARACYKGGNRSVTREIEEAQIALQGLRRMVETAAYGSSPFFTESRLDQALIARAIEFDANFLEGLRDQVKAAEKVLGLAEGGKAEDLSTAIRGLSRSALNLKNTFSDRSALMSGAARITGEDTP